MTATRRATAIRQDSAGRYCLNDCHRASGGDKKDGPSYWLATKEAEKLVAKLNEETAGVPVVTVEGRNGGTFVVKELVYAYAMWKFPYRSIRQPRPCSAYSPNLGRPPLA